MMSRAPRSGSKRLVVPASRSEHGTHRRFASSELLGFPFAATLSLDPVIAYWATAAREGIPLAARLNPEIESYVATHPILREPVDDLGRLTPHTAFVELLLSALFPTAFADTDPLAAFVPFEYRSIHATPAFTRLFSHESGMLSGRVHLDTRTFTYGKIVSAYLHILRNVYGVEAAFDYPVTFTTRDAETGLDRHFRVTTDLRFVRIEHLQEPPHVDRPSIGRLLTHVSDLAEWMRLIPPAGFAFSGVSIVRAVDVTDERMFAMLERDLVEEGSLVNRSSLPDVEEHVRTLLCLPHLELGLAAIDGDEFFLLNEPAQPIVDTFFTRSARYPIAALSGSIFERCFEDGSIHAVEDMAAMTTRSRIEDDLVGSGVRHLVAAPLFAETDRVGILYVWSPKATSLQGLNVMKLLELLPVFSAAVHRAREEMRNRVRNVIMGQYTAIHPTVEWRFRQAALGFIQRQEREQSKEIEPIVFESVYPLFAATDIRASSEHRNQAVQHDLIDHLELAIEILQDMDGGSGMIHHVLDRTERYRSALQEGLVSSDEAAVRDFIQSDLDPVLLDLKGSQADGGEDGAAHRYRQAVDADHGTIYERSRAFERSVERVNSEISSYLDDEQERLQPLMPHYFEKHQTDGVDFTIYAGASLMENADFEDESVSVLRLWQLMVLCGIAHRTASIRKELDVPLETTHLILVQNTPIDIRYRFDETRFDVDGPHHVRFEIMKQRVEKAHVKMSSERLTQPDRIAIVYSQEREIQEYAAYVEYLQEQSILAPVTETVDLDDLQGMKGLRALRVHPDASGRERLPEFTPEELVRVARLSRRKT